MKHSLFAVFLLSASTVLGGAKAPDRPSDKDCPKPVDFFFQEECSKWYVGGGVSFADPFSYKKSGEALADTTFIFLPYDSVSDDTVSAPSLGYNVFIGYSHNDYINLEFKGLQILRPFKNNFTVDVDTSIAGDTYTGTSKLYVASFGPYLLVNLPVCEYFTPYLRSGMVTSYVELKRNFSNALNLDADALLETGNRKQTLWAEKLNIGIGFKASWRDFIVLRAEYETPTSNNILGESISHLNDTIYIPGALSASILIKF